MPALEKFVQRGNQIACCCVYGLELFFLPLRQVYFLHSIRDGLIEATASLHRQVDSLFSMDRITTPRGYGAMLMSHAAVVPGTEAFLRRSRHLVDLPRFEERMRTTALENDMRALKLAPASAAPMSFLNSRGAVAGLLYVLEGSRLGATVIRRRLAKSGASYPTDFLSHGENCGFWQSYLSWLQSTQWSPDDLVDMRDSAVALFRQYLVTAEACFSPYEPEYQTTS